MTEPSLRDHSQPVSQEDPGLSSICVQLIQSVKSFINTTRTLTQTAQGKFTDKAVGDRYQRVMNENVERTELLLESLLGYLKVSAPIKKNKYGACYPGGDVKRPPG